MPSLRIKLPNNQGEVTHVLTGEKITIGRRPENTIQIVDRTVSAHHAELIGINGHYRLHDLGSTNLTCVDGQPVTDFHLHRLCKVSFGTIEAEYSPETPVHVVDTKTELVPTRAEMEFIRRENLDLQTKLAAQQKQIDILSSARLMTKETTQLGVQPDVHRRVVSERDTLKKENTSLQLEVEGLRCDITTLTRDRDALRQAWDTVKNELNLAEEEIERLRSGARAAAKAVNPAASGGSLPGRADTQLIGTADQHRQMANVLTKAPGLVESIRDGLQKITAAPGDEVARRELASQAGALAECTSAVQGHPIQRLASAIDSLLRDLLAKPDPLELSALRTLSQAAELVPGLLDPRALKRAKELPPHRILAVDHDQTLLATLVASLEIADLQTTGCETAAGALEELRARHFDLVLLDTDLIETNGFDLCRDLRAVTGYEQTPVIFLSGGNTAENRTKAEAISTSDFLSKPFNILELTLKAQTWIYRNQFALL